MPQFWGCHVSSAGGLESALEAGDALGVNTIQIHPSPPQRWISKPFPAGIETAFLERRKRSKVQQVFFHGIYLMNLATPDAAKFHLSKQSLAYYLDLAHRVGSRGVIFHVGSNVDQPDESVGFARAAEGINWALSQAKNEARLIMEVAAGGGAVIGDRMEELKTIYEQIEQQDRVGFGLDTQHMWASGYDWQSNLEAIVDEIDRLFGLHKVWAIHLNDSKTALASRKDRHENFGDGLIGAETMRKVLMHPKFANIPFMLETPALKDLESAKVEVEKVRAVIDAR